MTYASLRLASPVSRYLPALAFVVYAVALIAEVMTRGGAV